MTMLCFTIRDISVVVGIVVGAYLVIYIPIMRELKAMHKEITKKED